MIEIVKNILQLPELAYATRIFPKSFFERHFSLTPSEKKLLNIPFLPVKSIWLAELNQKTINSPSVETETYSYSRLPIFVIELSVEHWMQHLDKICNLYHKYLPFQALIFVHTGEQYCVSVATKSINQNDKEKRVLEEEYRTPAISLLLKDENEEGFRDRMAFINLDRINLKTIYDSYIAAIINYKRAVKTGDFQVKKEVKQVNQNLNELEQIEKETAVIRNKLIKTKDIREKVKLQMQLQGLRERKVVLEKIL